MSRRACECELVQSFQVAAVLLLLEKLQIRIYDFRIQPEFSVCMSIMDFPVKWWNLESGHLAKPPVERFIPIIFFGPKFQCLEENPLTFYFFSTSRGVKVEP